jgi:hypothetical protein
MPSTGYRNLVNMTDVRGDNTIVEGTRIGVHDVVGLIVNGSSIDDVVRSFPDLTRAHGTPKQEARLVQIATNAGTDAGRLLKKAVFRKPHASSLLAACSLSLYPFLKVPKSSSNCFLRCSVRRNDSCSSNR